MLEFHRIKMVRGGTCSKHKHEYKWNGFYVQEGRLLIKVWQDKYDLVDETTLGPGQYTKVPPGLFHQFHCLDDGIAYELYWTELRQDDIVRETCGTRQT